MAADHTEASSVVPAHTPITDKERARLRADWQKDGLRFPELEPGEFDDLVIEARKVWNPEQK